MKRYLYSLLLTMLLVTIYSGNAGAQDINNVYDCPREKPGIARTELGLLGGTTLYAGDLTPAYTGNINDATPHAGIFLRRYLGKTFSFRINLSAGQLRGDDAKYDNPAWRKHRGFSFVSQLYEASTMLECDIWRHRRLSDGFRYGIYVFAGIGACYTDPQRNFNRSDAAYFSADDKAVIGADADFATDPRHIAVVAPLGLGLRYDISQNSTLFFEGSLRQGFDDNIDGFSASVSSAEYDAYSYYSLGIVLRFVKDE